MFEENLKRNNLKEANSKTDNDSASVLSLAFELGYLIALPIITLALLGRMLDKKMDSSPWFLLGGIIISMITTTYLVYRKTISIIDKK